MAKALTPDQMAKREALLASRIDKVYSQAEKEITAKMKDFNKAFSAKDKAYRDKVKAGEITQEDYDAWKRGQVFQSEQFAAKKKSIQNVLYDADLQAANMVRGESMGIYAESANYSAFKISSDTGIMGAFGIYDEHTVSQLIADNPHLLPKANVNKPKSYTWYNNRINNCITQGIIQGESVQDIAKRIGRETSESCQHSLMRAARTAMTAAENGGRLAAVQDARAAGINIKRRWMATLDKHTRDTHAELDGKLEDDKGLWHTALGALHYPGDPTGAPADVYNCRCTTVYFYPEYDTSYMMQRRDNETGAVIQDMTYSEWKHSVEAGKLGELNIAKEALATAQSDLFTSFDMKQKWSGIWKDDVTLADYKDKKSKIQDKIDYFQKQKWRASNRGDRAEYDRFDALLDAVFEYQANGEAYLDMLKARNDALAEVNKVLKSFMPQPPGQFAPDAWDDSVRAAAMRFTDKDDADRFHRAYLDGIWGGLSDHEKYGVWEYTHNSNPMNKSLSGYHDSWSRYNYIGPQNTDWGHENSWRTIDTSAFKKFAKNGHVDYHGAITQLTTGIDKTSLPDGVILVRGSDSSGIAGMIEGNGLMSFDEGKRLFDGTTDISDIKAALEGQRIKNHAFTSTGIATGTGFSGEISYEIYAPKGTHAIYAEPQSYFGNTSSSKIYKAGESYYSVGHEAEVVIQRGTVYEVRDVEEIYPGKYVVKMDVVEQPDYFAFGDEDTFNSGATRHKS